MRDRAILAPPDGHTPVGLEDRGRARRMLLHILTKLTLSLTPRRSRTSASADDWKGVGGVGVDDYRRRCFERARAALTEPWRRFGGSSRPKPDDTISRTSACFRDRTSLKISRAMKVEPTRSAPRADVLPAAVMAAARRPPLRSMSAPERGGKHEKPHREEMQ